MLDALSEEFAVVVLGFPDNGRTTLHSSHYVYGTKLEDSQFRPEPVHPMTKSHYISFLAYVTSEKFQMIKLYPEGNAECRFRLRGRGYLYCYCNRHGLMVKQIR